MVILPIVLPPQAEVDAMSPDEEMVTNDSSIVDAQINIQVVRAAQAMEARFRHHQHYAQQKHQQE